MTPRIALMRRPPATYPRCVKRHEPDQPIDLDKALLQHSRYAQVLQQLDVETVVLDALPDFPDSVFIEDNALVIDDRAILCPSAEPSRRGEEARLAPILARYKRVQRLTSSACIDGGDCLKTDRHLFIGLSQRTNREAFDHLAQSLPDYAVVPIPMRTNGVLHLKSAVSYLGANQLLVAADEVDATLFPTYDVLRTPVGEQAAANCARVGDAIIAPVGFPGTVAMLRQRDRTVLEVDVSEFNKGDGSLTCLCLFL